MVLLKTSVVELGFSSTKTHGSTNLTANFKIFKKPHAMNVQQNNAQSAIHLRHGKA